MNLKRREIISLGIEDMRICRDKLIQELVKVSGMSRESLTHLINRNKCIMVELRNGYFPLKCKMTYNEIQNADFTRIEKLTYDKPGYFIITGVNHMSTEFMTICKPNLKLVK